ncbi:hypothetical protein OF83DRAFT_1178960 [Amylostereum chailletii]|nr:hypothetical protein OF83DRAFT_1178960 [Amylostereum chailletii]
MPRRPQPTLLTLPFLMATSPSCRPQSSCPRRPRPHPRHPTAFNGHGAIACSTLLSPSPSIPTPVTLNANALVAPNANMPVTPTATRITPTTNGLITPHGLVTPNTFVTHKHPRTCHPPMPTYLSPATPTYPSPATPTRVAPAPTASSRRRASSPMPTPSSPPNANTLDTNTLVTRQRPRPRQRGLASLNAHALVTQHRPCRHPQPPCRPQRPIPPSSFALKDHTPVMSKVCPLSAPALKGHVPCPLRAPARTLDSSSSPRLSRPRPRRAHVPFRITFQVPALDAPAASPSPSMAHSPDALDAPNPDTLDAHDSVALDTCAPVAFVTSVASTLDALTPVSPVFVALSF